MSNLVEDPMSEALPNLTNLPPEVQAFVAAQAVEIAGLKSDMKAERTTYAMTIQNRDLTIADLRLQLHGHKKHRFGSRSESSAQLTLELILEEHEIAQASETTEDDANASDAEAKPPRTPRVRKPFPK